MRYYEPDWRYFSPGVGAELTPPTYPAVVVRGQTYTITVPVSWEFKNAVYYVAQNLYWEEIFYFTFGARWGTNEPVMIDFIRDPGLAGVREGTDFFPVTFKINDGPMALDLHPGITYTVYLHAQVFAYYRSEADPDVWRWGELVTGEVAMLLTVVEGTPTASFNASPTSGEAPLTVQFIDTSDAPAETPITAWLWDFGDGQTSANQHATHVYNNPGTYIATLMVTNQYGSDSATATITVVIGAVRPVFDAQSWCPSAVDVDEAFAPVLIIDNLGGEGNIYVEYILEGKTHSLVSSVALPGYGTYTVPIGNHTIDWFLGYVPEKSRYVNIVFKTGPVGQAATGQFPVEIAVYVGEEPPPEEAEGIPWWVYAASGLGIVGVIAVLLRKK